MFDRNNPNNPKVEIILMFIIAALVIGTVLLASGVKPSEMLRKIMVPSADAR